MLALLGAAALAGAPQVEEIGGAGETAEPAPILHGEDATSEDWPMTGGILAELVIAHDGWTETERRFTCTSTLIAPDVVLTAAHCMDPAAFAEDGGELAEASFRWSRQHDLSAFTGDPSVPWPEDAIPVAGHVLHPDWSWGLTGGIARNDDLALLFLERAVRDVAPAWLPLIEEAGEVRTGREVVVVGWGQQEPDARTASTYGHKQTGVSTLAEVGTFEMHVGAEATAVRKCFGDSGGPSFLQVYPDEAGWRLVGVTSHAWDASGCEETGGVDTRVDAYIDWIDAELRAACADGTRAWCAEPGLGIPPEPDTGLTGADTGPADPADPSAPRIEGCGCRSAGGGALLWPLLLLAVRRRGRAPQVER